MGWVSVGGRGGGGGNRQLKGSYSEGGGRSTGFHAVRRLHPSAESVCSGVARPRRSKGRTMHLALLTLSLTLTAADAPKAEPLWPKAAPGAMGDKDADAPTLTAF